MVDLRSIVIIYSNISSNIIHNVGCSRRYGGGGSAGRSNT